MKKFTFIFSLFIAMFTTAMAQESVNFLKGEFKGTAGDKSSWSQYVSENGVTIIATDANGNEVASMREFNGYLRLYILEGVATPIKYTLTVPEGYKLSEMKFKNSAKSYNMALEYGSRTYTLTGNTDEYAIIFTDDNTFKLYGEIRNIDITSLTITKIGDENEGGGNEGEGENGGNEGEGENGGNEGENGGNEGEGENGGNEGEGENGGNEGEGENGGNEGENGGNEGEGENGGNEGEGENGGNEGENGGNEGNEGEGEGENGGNEGEGENGDNANSINEVSVEAEQVIYDLTGRRVEKITKAGIYIINGKKVIK